MQQVVLGCSPLRRDLIVLDRDPLADNPPGWRQKVKSNR